MSGFMWFGLALLVLKGLYELSGWFLRETILRVGFEMERELRKKGKEPS